jgi:hypothetical protein
MRNCYFTKEEALRRAEAWLSRRNPQNDGQPWFETHLQDFPNQYEIHVQSSSGGGSGGMFVVTSASDELDGTVTVIEESSAEVKQFRWMENPEDCEP